MSAILIIINGGDIASVVQANALLDMGDWIEGNPVEGFRNWSLENVYLWWIEKSILFEDDLDQRWYDETGINVDEVIFPSRHSSQSGIPSLTLHYIGVTHLHEDEIPPFGGKSGKAPPPNPRLAAWFRLLNKKMENSELKDDFEVTLEATHHGPWLKTPSLYIEIGSDESAWSRKDAAQILAAVIWEGLGLDGSDGHGLWDESQDTESVVICFGGGHYAPRHSLLALNEGIWLGHILANYSLPMIKNDMAESLENLTVLGGTWKDSILEAIKSTKIAYGNAKISAYLDRKSFKGWQRRAIVDFLQTENIFVGRTSDFVK